MPLDIRKITRKCLLVPGSGVSWQWLVNDRQMAGISIRVDWRCMVLSYCMNSTGEVVEQRVQTQKYHLATWAGSASGLPAHCAVNMWRCSTRRADTSPAASLAGWATPQKEGAGDRASSKADKLRKRLGWQAGILHDGGGVPKGIHWTSYQVLKSQHDVLAQVSFHDIGRKLSFLHKLLQT